MLLWLQSILSSIQAWQWYTAKITRFIYLPSIDEASYVSTVRVKVGKRRVLNCLCANLIRMEVFALHVKVPYLPFLQGQQSVVFTMAITWPQLKLSSHATYNKGIPFHIYNMLFVLGPTFSLPVSLSSPASLHCIYNVYQMNQILEKRLNKYGEHQTKQAIYSRSIPSSKWAVCPLHVGRLVYYCTVPKYSQSVSGCPAQRSAVSLVDAA